MKLQHLFAHLSEVPENSWPHIEVSGVNSDARQIETGGVFVAIKGLKLDGHDYILQAIQNGASVLVVENNKNVPANFSGFVLVVENSRESLDILSARFNWNPSDEMYCVGVTGTNGKTSITYLVECILNHSNISTGVIGTINHHLNKIVWPSEMTTPGPVDLQRRLREFKESGAKAVAMEVSSHALDQFRVDSISFDAVIFSNLTRDHLDYHGSMQEYLNAKQRLFTDLLWKSKKEKRLAVVNIDDKYGRRLQIADVATTWTYGDAERQPEADFKYQLLSMTFDKTDFELSTPHGEVIISLPMPGIHNAMNATAAIAAAVWTGVSLESCREALRTFSGIPGRLQRVVSNADLSVFVDYAHTPDALENVLLALHAIRDGVDSPQGTTKIWTIFGCGGDRDKGKRPLMAQKAFQYSDYIVITSDNPRTEDPMRIIEEIKAGLNLNDSNNIIIEPDRKKAIELVISKANAGDVILIAGKGHEDYQIIGLEKYPFSDYVEAFQALGNRNR